VARSYKEVQKKNTNPATLALRKAARGLHHSKSSLGAFYRRMRAKQSFAVVSLGFERLVWDGTY